MKSFVIVRRRLMRLTLIIPAVLFLSICFAQFDGGDGSAENPWQISRALNLDSVRNYLGQQHNNKHFIQTANINLGEAPWNEGQGWVPIGGEGAVNRFMGKYNGSGFSISNLTIDRPNVNYQALFAYTENALLENIHLEDVDITGGQYVGGLIAYKNSSIVVNCSVGGSVSSNVFWSYIGGLIGHQRYGNNETNAVINCYSRANVTGQFFPGGLIGYCSTEGDVIGCWASGNVTGSYEVGGLIGYSQNNIRDSYATGNVQGGDRTGGLIGNNTSGQLTNSYATGNVSGGNRIGGLTGANRGTISNCYSTGRVTGTSDLGGLVGHNSGQVNDSYWDTVRSQINNSAGGMGRVTLEMIYPYDGQGAYNRWDFDDIWVHDINRDLNQGYPVLYHQVDLLDLDTPEVTVDIIIIDDVEHIRVQWESVTNALSYKIFSADNPYDEDWGDPVAIVGEDVTLFTRPLSEADKKFFYVVASIEEVP